MSTHADPAWVFRQRSLRWFIEREWRMWFELTRVTDRRIWEALLE